MNGLAVIVRLLVFRERVGNTQHHLSHKFCNGFDIVLRQVIGCKGRSRIAGINAQIKQVRRQDEAGNS